MMYSITRREIYDDVSSWELNPQELWENPDFDSMLKLISEELGDWEVDDDDDNAEYTPEETAWYYVTAAQVIALERMDEDDRNRLLGDVDGISTDEAYRLYSFSRAVGADKDLVDYLYTIC